MTKLLISDMSPSVQWVDVPSEIDTAYTENVELVPLKASQALIGPIQTENHVDQLFDYEPAQPWAHFEPFAGYRNRLRKLFFRKVLSSFSPDKAIRQIDEFFDTDTGDEEGESDALYEMLYSLKSLDDLLDEIWLRILTTIKT